MPFPMRIQPIDVDSIQHDAVVVTPPPVLKSRLKRLFDHRPFTSVAKITSSAADFEQPSSVCLDKMVQNFIEDNNNNEEKQSSKLSRHGCNCFNGNSNDISDDEFDFFSESLTTSNSSLRDLSDALKNLVACTSEMERNILAETWRIVENNKAFCKGKDELRKMVADGLIAQGYNASVCRSKWDKSSFVPSGEYEYIDVITEGERLIVDIEFQSEFEIARSTSSYKQMLECLPNMFVGKSDRLLQIVSIASEAARLSLKKKGMHIAPWRKAGYMRAKWLGPYTRFKNDAVLVEVMEMESQLEQDKSRAEMMWQLPAVRLKSSLEKGNSKVVVVTGLASLLKEKI